MSLRRTPSEPHAKPSWTSLALAAVPVVALCLAVPWWDRINPRIFGLPFNLAWLIGWTALTPFFLLLVYRREKRRIP